MLGGIRFTNEGSTPCALRGFVGVEVFAQAGQPLDVTVTPTAGDPFNGIEIGASLNQSPVAVALAPGASSAYAVTEWFNWCGPAPGNVQLKLVLPDGEHLTSLPRFDNGPVLGIPRCDDPQSTSIFYITAVGHVGP
jgi:hypothetical protein